MGCPGTICHRRCGEAGSARERRGGAGRKWRRLGAADATTKTRRGEQGRAVGRGATALCSATRRDVPAELLPLSVLRMFSHIITVACSFLH